MKYLFRLVRALVGYNLCFFDIHRWVWDEVHCYDNWGVYTGKETYQKCSRCRTIKLSTIRRVRETA